MYHSYQIRERDSMKENKNNTTQACTQRRYEITEADLPLSCPPRDLSVWDAHPRVYLPVVEAGGEVTCPYCDAVYTLKTYA